MNAPTKIEITNAMTSKDDDFQLAGPDMKRMAVHKLAHHDIVVSQWFWWKKARKLFQCRECKPGHVHRNITCVTCGGEVLVEHRQYKTLHPIRRKAMEVRDAKRGVVPEK